MKIAAGLVGTSLADPTIRMFRDFRSKMQQKFDSKNKCVYIFIKYTGNGFKVNPGVCNVEKMSIFWIKK